MFLEKLKRLHEAATEAPWDMQKDLPLAESTLSTVAWVGDWQVGVDSGIKGGNYRDGLVEDQDADAALIALLRNKAGAIIALVEAANKANCVDAESIREMRRCVNNLNAPTIENGLIAAGIAKRKVAAPDWLTEAEIEHMAELGVAWVGEAAFAKLCALALDGLKYRCAEWKHVANEWADETTNGLQLLRNIRDGISDFDAAEKALLAGIERCRKLASGVAEQRTAAQSQAGRGSVKHPDDTTGSALQASGAPDSPAAAPGVLTEEQIDNVKSWVHRGLVIGNIEAFDELCALALDGLKYRKARREGPVAAAIAEDLKRGWPNDLA